MGGAETAKVDHAYIAGAGPSSPNQQGNEESENQMEEISGLEGGAAGEKCASDDNESNRASSAPSPPPICCLVMLQKKVLTLIKAACYGSRVVAAAACISVPEVHYKLKETQTA